MLWFRIGLIYCLGVVVPMTLGLLGPLANDLRAAMNLSPQGMGMVAGVLYLPFLLMATFVGRAADRVGTRNMLLISAALVFVANLSNLKADNLLWLMADNFILGLAMIAVFVAGQAELIRTVPGKMQAGILALWSTAPYIGMSSGFILSGRLAGTPMWRMAFAGQGLAAAGLAIGVMLLIRPRIAGQTSTTTAAHGGAHGGGGSLRSLIREYKIISLGVAFLSITITTSSTPSVWPFFLSKLNGTSIETIANMLAVTAPTAIPGAFCTGYLLTKGVSIRTILVMAVAVGILTGVVVYMPGLNLGALGVVMAIWAFCVGATTALTYAAIPRFVMDKDNMASATGLVLQLSSFGGICGPPLLFAITALPRGSSLVFAIVVVTCWSIFAGLVPVWRKNPDGPLSPPLAA